MKRVNLTKTFIKDISLPEKGRIEYEDSQLKGLTLRVSYSGHKAFYYFRWYRNRMVRIKIGDWPDLSVDEARQQVQDYNNKAAKKINPMQEVAAHRQDIEFKDLFALYMDKWAKVNKKSWRTDERLYKAYYSKAAFNRKFLHDITKRDIANLFTSISKEHPRTANLCLAILSSIFNRAIDWGLLDLNPCKGIKKNKEVSRERFLQEDELPRFLEAVNCHPQPIMRGFFIMALLTGARCDNVRSMKWSDINFKMLEWRIPETKGGRPHKIPLTKHIIAVLDELKQYRVNEYVFPADSTSGHLVEPKKPWRTILENAGLQDKQEVDKRGSVINTVTNELRIHDLRRTLASWLAITGASYFVIAAILGHKVSNVTGVYARLSMDSLREALEKAQEAMLKQA